MVCTNFVLVTKLGANNTTYTDTNLLVGTTYRYRVSVQGSSQFSNIAGATTFGPSPTPTPSPTPSATPTPTPSATPTPSVTPTPVPTPVSGDAWTTYGHDVRRSGASQGSIPGALRELWRYKPLGLGTSTAASVQHVIATESELYLRWATYVSGHTMLEKATTSGTRVWVEQSCCNWDKQHWPALSPDRTTVFVNDDGTFIANTTNGTRTRFLGLDTWGDVLIDPSGLRYYAVNMRHQVDPGSNFPTLYLAAYDKSLNKLWEANRQPASSIGGQEDLLGGAIALNNGTLFHAAIYNPGNDTNFSLTNGISALDSSNGSQRWFVAATPASRISVNGDKIYLIEGFATRVSTNIYLLTGTHLVARSQTNGSLVWSHQVSFPVAYSSWKQNPDGTWVQIVIRGTHVQSPVLAGGLVIIGTEGGVVAFDAVNGNQVWLSSMTGASSPQVYGSGRSEFVDTRIAAALGSNTLVVTASNAIHVLSIASGTQAWSGTAPSAIGPVRNPVIVGSRVYVTDGTTSQNGGLIALEGQ